MTKFKLIVSLPYDKTYEEKIVSALTRVSYEKIFWHSFAPPHKIELKFSHLSEDGVNNWKNFFREAYKDSLYREYCKFEIIDMAEAEANSNPFNAKKYSD